MLGIIAGNGRFPFLALEEAVRLKLPVVVAAIREEADPSIEDFARRGPIQVHWLGLGQLGRLLRLFKRSGVDRAMMCGQVKHVRIFARDGRPAAGALSALPDLAMLRLLAKLARKNTASLIGAIADVLNEAGVELIDSTHLLGHLLPEAGIPTKRRPARDERRDIACGRSAARLLARLDIGQTVVIKDQAIVAVEAMEGTDQTIRRAARLAEGRRLTVVKASRPRQEMRFDVPVLGLATLDVFEECRVRALSIDAGRTLLLDREQFMRRADGMKLAISVEVPSEEEPASEPD